MCVSVCVCVCVCVCVFRAIWEISLSQINLWISSTVLMYYSIIHESVLFSLLYFNIFIFLFNFLYILYIYFI